MSRTKKLLIVTDPAGNLIAAADTSFPNEHGITMQIRARKDQELHEIDVPEDLMRLHPRDFKDAVSKALLVPGAKRKHVPVHPKRPDTK